MYEWLQFRFIFAHNVHVFPGGIFDQNSKLNEAMLNFAVAEANEKILSESGIQLAAISATIEYGNEIDASEKVCELLKVRVSNVLWSWLKNANWNTWAHKMWTFIVFFYLFPFLSSYVLKKQSKANAIFAPRSAVASAQISSICDVKEIPYIDTHMDIYMKKSASINLYPSEEDLTQLLIDVVDQYEWEHLTVLYEAPFYSKRIDKFLEDRNDKPGSVSVQPLDVGQGLDFHKVLHRVKELNDRSKNIIIESSIEHLSEILNQVNFMDEYSVILQFELSGIE